MDQAKGRRIIVTMFFLNMFIITWQEIQLTKNGQNPSPIGWPRPSRYIGLAVAMSVLAIFGEVVSAELAAVFAVGLTLGMIMQTEEHKAVQTKNPVTSTPQSIPIIGIAQV